CPINTTNARRIVDKARKDLVRERIRVINNKLDAFKEKKITLETKLFTSLSREEQQNVTRHIAHVSESTHEKKKWRHQQKIQRLETKRDRINDADLTGTQLKRWVINLSKYKLSGNQNKILAKGLNYAVTPEKIPTEEFVVAAEQATWSLPQEQKDKLRADITGVLKSAKVPKQNITRQERTALKGLQKEKSITILPADKGKATVIMETREYQEKMKEMLNDEATYEKLKKDPTKKYKAELIRMVNSLEKEGKITKDQYWYLYPTLEKVPRMYGSPKIHKEGVPLRPIVDYTQTIAYRVSRELANILQPLVGKTEHHTENSQELVKEMTKLRVEEGESFVSYDVVSLFTKTPIKEACEIIRKRLENDKTLKKRTNLNVDDIMELLKFVLETTYFRFEGEIYQQKFGVAMGSPVSPIVVNLYMEDLEQKIIATA
ncbi:hypothetical protein LSAT2_017403, partial [Lamellibrachia satsuma]